jgi:hypothetical protein
VRYFVGTELPRIPKVRTGWVFGITLRVVQVDLDPGVGARRGCGETNCRSRDPHERRRNYLNEDRLD